MICVDRAIAAPDYQRLSDAQKEWILKNFKAEATTIATIAAETKLRDKNQPRRLGQSR